MADRFERFYTNLKSPAKNAFHITPSDSANLTIATRSLYIGGAGTVKFDTVGGETITITGALAGTILPVRINKVYSSNTSATGLVGFY